MNLFIGKKSYFVAVATVVYAVSGVFLGHVGMDEAIELVLASSALASLRHAIGVK